MQIFFFAFTLWLGSYLLSRKSNKFTVQLTGAGLVTYALAIALQIIFKRFFPIVALAPALFWIGAALHLLPEDDSLRATLIRVWVLTSIPLAILTQLNAGFAIVIILELMLCAGLITKLARHSHFKNTFSLLAVVALFVTLSTGLLILPLNWMPPSWGLALLGFDLFCLGLVITVWDAFDEGESVRAHLIRSFVSSLYYAGTLAVIAIVLSQNVTLLVLLVAFGVLTQTFSDSIQALLDKLTLPPQTSDERQTLRQTADALPLLSSLESASVSEEQFTRLTRRALSHLGDLPKLATSPLVNLPHVQGAHPLDRAQALKSMLIRSIQKLKPLSDAKFGTTDEWRYYNSVYFPYVLGLKPYTRRTDHASLDEISRLALDWFQTAVPERTLRNWQNAAARLIADDIRGPAS